jgi:hypothetical protein
MVPDILGQIELIEIEIPKGTEKGKKILGAKTSIFFL